MGSTHTFNMGKVHGSLARAGKVKSDTKGRPDRGQAKEAPGPCQEAHAIQQAIRQRHPHRRQEENEPEPRRKDGLSGVSNRQSSPFLLFHFINSLPSAVCPTSRRGGWLGPRSSSL